MKQTKIKYYFDNKFVQILLNQSPFLDARHAIFARQCDNVRIAHAVGIDRLRPLNIGQRP